MSRARPFAVLSIAALVLVAGAVRAGVLRRLTDVREIRYEHVVLDDAGTFAWALSTDDPSGLNPVNASQVVRWSLPSMALTQLTGLTRGATAMSVSGDGATMALIARDDPFGTNPDHGPELFVAAGDGSGLQQLTVTPGARDTGVYEVHVARSGNRIAFVAVIDPLGGNADLGGELFVVDADGSNLTQLTSMPADGSLVAPWIADDGSRATFVSRDDLVGANPNGVDQLFAVEYDGTSLRQLSPSSMEPIRSAAFCAAYMVYERAQSLYLKTWSGSTELPLGPGSSPSLSADCKWLYWSRNDSGSFQIHRRLLPSGTPEQLTSTPSGTSNTAPVVSGNAVRVAFSSTSAFGSGVNPDGNAELVVADADGANAEQLTETTSPAGPGIPDLTPDGSKAVFAFADEIDRLAVDGGTPEQLTIGATAYADTPPSTTADASSTVFLGLWDSGTCSPVSQVYRVDGDGLTQLTPDTCEATEPAVVSAQGGMVVFFSTGSFSTADGPALFKMSMGGGTIEPLIDDGGIPRDPRIDDDGTWIAYTSRTDLDGLNPAGIDQVFRARVDGTLVERLTADVARASSSADISGDGGRVVFTSSADLVGQNADLGNELFVYDAAGATYSQLTDSAAHGSFSARISGNGRYVVFRSTMPVFGDPRTGTYRLDTATDTIERASGLLTIAGGDWPRYAIDDSGERIVFSTRDEAMGLNPDGSWEIWLADFEAAPRIEPSPDAPTIVTWEPDPRSQSYDVIRGSLADLSVDGDHVDLGAVACLEEDSADVTTAGYPDAAQPGPGEGFFFVLRGSQGPVDPEASWGEGSGGLPRLPSAGGCAP